MWEMIFPRSNGCSDGTIRYAARYSSSSVEEHERVVQSLLAVYKSDRMCCSEFLVIDAMDIDFDYEKMIPMEDLLMGKLCYDASSSDTSVHTRGVIYASSVMITNTLTDEKITVQTINCEVKRDGDDARNDRDPMRRDAARYPWTGKNMPDRLILGKKGSYSRRMKLVRDCHANYINGVSEILPMIHNLCVNTYTRDVTLCPEQRQKLLDDLNTKYAMNQRAYYKLPDPSSAWRSLSFDGKRKANYDEHDSWLDEKRYITHIEHKYFTRVYKDDVMLSLEQRNMMKYRANDKFTTMIHDMDKDDMDLFDKEAMRYWVHLK